ncbi:tRNA glutamyl-Q(34) synthetase GluQRS [Sulfuritalea sp.]|uniref:tRNA glutamyl-Q(34) synthetase GluQRS n=1 Tax=Sulfuritalea sp. TaxID=2480090 RepID=UPI001ACE1FFD|nr:tRNA glutamyl-Q(34) synthetase GluQRS [Sulfuritalea sp.]MBN8474007.1 tRNA glutamyl-Q(34) synthetase GluQRS [Sulfuritalea sp.]
MIALPLPYRGRFAPSPTGPLHFGSLVAATGSFLEARSRGGEWLLRMEDVDLPRCSTAAADEILHTLEAFGFAWDGEEVWQSRRGAAYAAALERLRAARRVFPCACTRRELADSAIAPDGAAIYPGTCRDGLPSGRTARSWRLRVGDARVGFDDAIQGRIESDLVREAGDFVLLRADGLHAYQLAVVVDDAAAGITDVVRGADLLTSTARQIFLQQCLGFATPSYAHLPVVVNAAGEKLSKQTLAPPLDARHPAQALVAALRFLGQAPPADLALAGVDDVWRWALANWRLDRVPRGPLPFPVA